jgi:hypothetical protein
MVLKFECNEKKGRKKIQMETLLSNLRGMQIGEMKAKIGTTNTCIGTGTMEENITYIFLRAKNFFRGGGGCLRHKKPQKGYLKAR